MVKRKPQSRTGAVTDAIINYLTMIGWIVYRNNTVGIWDPTQQIYRKNKKQMKGVPDIAGTDWLGRSVAIEIKIGNDRLSADQTIFAVEQIGRCGFYCIAGSIEDVIATLRIYGYAITENGMVKSTVMKTLTDSIFDEEPGAAIPNANKLKNLDIMERSRLSLYASGKQQKLVIKQWLGKYAERVINV